MSSRTRSLAAHAEREQRGGEPARAVLEFAVAERAAIVDVGDLAGAAAVEREQVLGEVEVRAAGVMVCLLRFIVCGGPHAVAGAGAAGDGDAVSCLSNLSIDAVSSNIMHAVSSRWPGACAKPP